MDSLLFGTAGVPASSPKPDSLAGIAHIRELGLDCMEMAWVRRVSMGEKTAAKVRQKAEECQVTLSKELGRAGLEDMHIHLSGIKYGPKGEREHIMLDEADIRYVEVLQALKDFGVRGLLICESPFQEIDALILQETYRQLKAQKRTWPTDGVAELVLR